MSRSITRRPRRHAICAVAFGVAVAIAPVWSAPVPVTAQAPTVAVTGLSRGSRGDAVKSVQQALVNQGISVSGGVDGIFGPGTETALKEFQQRNGLTASGVVDDASALALGLTSSPLLGLNQGVRGDAVKKLQRALTDAGVTFPGGVDGIFGPSTRAAVEQFQRQHGLSPTGIVDAATAAALATSPPTAQEPANEPAKQPAAPASGSSASGAAQLVGLKIGARGEGVKLLQRTIEQAGFTVVGGADGIFGALTSNALRSFQNANGLEVTGVVNEATATALLKVGTGDRAASDPHDPTVSSPLLGLQYGSIGADVKALQEALTTAGFRPRGGADGIFGSATVAALKSYQSKRGLSASGKVDQATANALASKATAGNSALTGLKAGALGNTVKQLQQSLIDAGIKVRGGADGIFGPATADALKAFQRSQGLEATGIVNSATAAALVDPKPAASANTDSGGYAQYGEKGQRVLALQAALVKAGITPRGGVDGDFGGGTSAAVMDFQRREGLSVTGKVNDATAAALGLAKAPAPTAPDATTVRLAAFPVQGKCYYGDSWGYPRGGGRVHLGVDIIAPSGKLIYAVADGRITKVYGDYPGSLSGNGVRLTMADGTYFFYAHMTGLADGIELGVPVKAGQILGTVGSTGSSGTPHLHFEVHPQGGSAVNPYPLVKAIDGCGRTEPLPQP